MLWLSAGMCDKNEPNTTDTWIAMRIRIVINYTHFEALNIQRCEEWYCVSGHRTILNQPCDLAGRYSKNLPRSTVSKVKAGTCTLLVRNHVLYALLSHAFFSFWAKAAR